MDFQDFVVSGFFRDTHISEVFRCVSPVHALSRFIVKYRSIDFKCFHICPLNP